MAKTDGTAVAQLWLIRWLVNLRRATRTNLSMDTSKQGFDSGTTPYRPVVEDEWTLKLFVVNLYLVQWLV